MHLNHDRISEFADSLMASSRLTAQEFNALLHEGETWLGEYFHSLQTGTQSADSSLDSTEVQMQLAEMQIDSGSPELLNRMNRLKQELDSVMQQPDYETSPELKRFATKCRELISILETPRLEAKETSDSGLHTNLS